MTQETPKDWVLLEAGKRVDANLEMQWLRDNYRLSPVFTALCDMIAKYEKEPVDPKLECAREAFAELDANKAYQYLDGSRDDYTDVQAAIRAIELWEARK